MNENPQIYCQYCRYAHKSTAKYSYECRRKPRVIIQPHNMSQFPIVENDDWCGEFQSGEMGIIPDENSRKSLDEKSTKKLDENSRNNKAAPPPKLSK